LDVSEDVPTF